MTMAHAPDVVIALAPVVVFLIALWLMDSFKLVRPASIAVALTFGAASAVAALWLHAWLQAAHAVSAGFISRYIAPLTEETGKALLMGALVAAGRIGFPVKWGKSSRSVRLPLAELATLHARLPFSEFAGARAH